MPRGGKRQGTPGKGYTNRTDLGMNYDNQGQSAAGGGVEAPRGSEPLVLPVYPDQIPDLSMPSQRPSEPITDGLASGPGRGPEALSNYDPRRTETQALKKWMPLLEPMMASPETPDSVKILLRYIRAS